MTGREKGSAITAWGETKSLFAWSRDPRCSVSLPALQQRVRDQRPGDSPEELISRPARSRPRSNARMLTAWGETKTYREWVQDERCGAPSVRAIAGRVRNMGPEDRPEDVLSRPAESKSRERRAITVTAWGETKTVPEWARDRRCSVDATVLYTRLSQMRPGDRPEDVISQPFINRATLLTAWGETKSIAAWARDPRCSISAQNLAGRVRNMDSGDRAEDVIGRPARQRPPRQASQRAEKRQATRPVFGR